MDQSARQAIPGGRGVRLKRLYTRLAMADTKCRLPVFRRPRTGNGWSADGNDLG